MLKTINRYWRILATGFSFALFGLGGFMLAFILLICLFPAPISTAKKQGFTRQSISRACWIYVRIMRGLGLLQFSFTYPERLKLPGQLVIANHPSLLDVVFLLSEMPNSNCIVKSALWRNPFTLGPVKLAGYIPNNSNTLVERAAEKIAQGQSLVIFPEGTRTQPGKSMHFKRGFANIALVSGCPITPVVITCVPATLQKHTKWYQVPERPAVFSFIVLPTYRPADYQQNSGQPYPVQVRHLSKRIFSMINHGLNAASNHKLTV